MFFHSRARLVFLGCVVVAGYFVYVAIAGAVHNHQLAGERSAAAQEVKDLENKKAHLGAVLQYVGSDAYVEQQARRQLGYTRDGEIPFVVISPPLKEDQAPAGDWWQRLFPR